MDRPHQLNARWLDYATARQQAAGSPLAAVTDWLDGYIVKAHPELGRGGAVCPYTLIARKCGALRFYQSPIRPEQEAQALELLHEAIDDLEHIPTARGDEQYQVIIIAFPDCESREGLAMLQRVLKLSRLAAMMRFRMLGFMHAGAEAEGLWNPEFRPLKAPLPLLVVRRLVETDAPFISRQHIQWVPYLVRYGWNGAKRLRQHRAHTNCRMQKSLDS